MFVISTVEEEICVPPSESRLPRETAVTRVIEANFINKVVPDLGLVVTLWDIKVSLARPRGSLSPPASRPVHI
jgi:DNA-directed RNA polymerase III subunit RPC8